jgi:hypothetical protein
MGSLEAAPVAAAGRMDGETLVPLLYVLPAVPAAEGAGDPGPAGIPAGIE